MKKMIIALALMILLVGVVYGAVTRSQPGADDTVTYTSALTGSYNKAYWAICEDVTGCTVSAVDCTGTRVDCDYAAKECDGTVGSSIRLVAYTAEPGGTVTTTSTVTVTGSETCTLNAGDYVESWNDGTPTEGGATTLPGSVLLSLGGGVDCPTLENDAFAAIIAWANNPIQANKNAALSAIVSWAADC